ncbi:RHS repeat-associated core domain-containing protein [Corallococcus sp. RDP092CA]|uniref:RHS repeat-associated core domain-containing protein n=1 Tax=Corallococcus sp. RDP092CA TaxID=3109369 RepID=UPI0035B062E8
MKRILLAVLTLSFMGGSCGPTTSEPSDSALGPRARNTGRLIDPPANTLLPTEIGTNGKAVGNASGLPGVSADGTATYSLPLWVPPGRAGMQPELSLLYRSEGGQGVLGAGWTLTGTSQISRCSQIQAQDGRTDGITFTSSDVFCLDGQRLVAVQGIYGASGTEYRTEQESFTRVVSLDADASGPGSFRVYLKNGRILTYGGLNQSTFVGERIQVSPQGEDGFVTTRDGKENRLSWSVARVEDRSGNSMSFHYTLTHDTNDSSYEQLLSRIEYAASSVGAGLAANRFVDLDYGPRPDTSVAFVAGLKIKLSQRLASITLRAPNPTVVGPVKQYRLLYHPTNGAPEALSTLASVQECDGANVCLNPITFEWTPETATFDDVDTGITDLMQTYSSVFDSIFWVLEAQDVDGDGRDDLLYRKPNNSGKYEWMLRYGAASGYGPGAVAMGLPGICNDVKANHNGRWVDVNMDGSLDVSILEWNLCGQPGQTSYLKHLRRTNGPGYNSYTTLEDDGKWGDDFWYADLDGDALPDLVRVQTVNNRKELGWRHNMGGNLQPFQLISTGPRNDNNQFVVNLDGSGRTSLLLIDLRQLAGSPDHYEEVGPRYSSVSLKNGVFSKQETTLVRTDVNHKQYLFADLNGDGLPEALRVAETGGDIEVLVNTGNGFAPPYLVDLPTGFEVGSFSKDNGLRLFDFNNDGRQDLLLLDDAGGTRSHPLVLQSTGTTFVATPLPFDIGQTTREGFKLSQVLDANGDGLPDFTQIINGSLHIYTRRGPPARLLSGVVNAAGGRAEFTYKPLSDASVYTPGSGCAYPQTCVKKGRWVVSETRIDAGVNQPLRTRRYTYEDGRLDLLGRGWLGFNAINATDVATGQLARTEFDNHTRVGTFYPYARQSVAESTTVTVGGRVLSQTRTTVPNSNLRLGLGGASILTVLPASGRVEMYDRLPTEGPTVGLTRRMSTTWTFDWTYGNLTARLEALQDGETRNWQSTYFNDASQWLIGLPAVVSENSFSPDVGLSKTRTVSTTYVPGTTLVATRTVQPGEPTLEQVTTYQRDPDGLLRQITLSGAGMAARTTTLTYDALDRTHPASVSNGLGHTLSYAYHRGMGLPAARVDANGLSSTWQYDGFGRPRTFTASGAAALLTNYSDCTATPGCLLEVHSREVVALPANPQDTPLAAGTESYTRQDRLGRSLSVRTRAFGDANGNGLEDDWVENSFEYDALGRQVKTWFPSPMGGNPVATSLTYDNLDRPLTRLHPDGTTVRWAYEGTKITYWDEKNRPSVTWMDSAGRVKTTDDLLGTQHLLTQYRYDAFGLLASVLDGNGYGPRFDYDNLGRQIGVHDPDSGTTLTYYNPFGEVSSETDARGDTTTYTRDVLGRVLTATNRDGVSRFTWDGAQGLGMLSTQVQETSVGNISTALTYDSLSRPVQENWSVLGAAYSFTRTYDAQGRLQTLSYPQVGGLTLATTNEYTKWGALKSVRDTQQSGVTYWTAEARNGLGQLTQERYGNSVRGTRRYDSRGRVVYIGSKTRRVIQALAYEYDVDGSLRSRHDQGRATTEDFTYDSLDRLTRWTTFQNCQKSVVDYSYDTTGNLLARTVSQGPGESLSLFYERTGGAGPHAVTRSSLGSYTYDASGNQLTTPERSVEYSTFNLPTKVTKSGQDTQFRYDAIHRRVVKLSPNGDITISLGGRYEVRRKTDGTALHLFNVLGAEGPVAQVAWSTDAAGSITQTRKLDLHKDSLGSVDTLTDEKGSVIERMRYEPFGGRRYVNSLSLPLTRSEASRVHLGFTGHETDEELGLINMKGRIYDPQLGRFLSPDPYLPAPRTSQSLNRYSYVLNNPLRYTDPSGFLPVEMPVIIYDSWYGGSAMAGGGGVWLYTVYREDYGGGSYMEAFPTNVGDFLNQQGKVMMPDGFAYFLLRGMSGSSKASRSVQNTPMGRGFGGNAYNEFARDQFNLSPEELYWAQKRESEDMDRWWERAKILGPLFLLVTAPEAGIPAVLLAEASANSSAAAVSQAEATAVASATRVEAAGAAAETAAASEASSASLSESAAAAAAQGGAKVVDVLRPGGKLIGQAGTSSQIRILQGGKAEAEALFGQLSKGGEVVAGSKYPGTLVRLPDGGTVGFRPVSTSGPPTIDVTVKGLGIREIKFIP